jgi:hypothetical protein
LQVAKLEIENFRGIREGVVRFAPHTVLIGSNNCGKTTIIEALALLFGRDRMVRQLTEHDFYGSNPQPPDRIRLIATITGFDGDDPARHTDWFRDDRGIVKWWNSVDSEVMPARADPSWRTRLRSLLYGNHRVGRDRAGALRPVGRCPRADHRDRHSRSHSADDMSSCAGPRALSVYRRTSRQRPRTAIMWADMPALRKFAPVAITA